MAPVGRLPYSKRGILYPPMQKMDKSRFTERKDTDSKTIRAAAEEVILQQPLFFISDQYLIFFTV